MKTKLLKRIRNRYIITKVDEIASNAGCIYEEAKKAYGLPFYVLEDKEENFYLGIKCFKTFDEARDKLHKWVINEYSERFRHKKEKSSKVWWIKK